MKIIKHQRPTSPPQKSSLLSRQTAHHAPGYIRVTILVAPLIKPQIRFFYFVFVWHTVLVLLSGRCLPSYNPFLDILDLNIRCFVEAVVCGYPTP